MVKLNYYCDIVNPVIEISSLLCLSEQSEFDENFAFFNRHLESLKLNKRTYYVRQPPPIPQELELSQQVMNKIMREHNFSPPSEN